MNTSRRAASTPRGFTLVELLVVVAIMAVLMSILLPSLSRARETARSVVCASNLRQFGIAHTMYADRFNNWYTPIRWTSVSLDEGYTWAWNPGFRDLLSLPPIDVAKDLQSHGDGLTHGGYPEGWGCPATVAMSGVDKRIAIGCVIHSYAMNRSNHPSRNDDMFQEGGDMWAYHRSSIVTPTEKIQMMDHNEWHMGMPHANYATQWDITGEVRPRNGGRRNVAYRHNEGTNTLRFDGHVKHMHKEEAWPANVQDQRDIWRVLQP